MNLLPSDKLEEVIRGFVSGYGVRATERNVGVHRDTVMRYFRILRQLREGQPIDVKSNTDLHVSEALRWPSVSRMWDRAQERARLIAGR